VSRASQYRLGCRDDLQGEEPAAPKVVPLAAALQGPYQELLTCKAPSHTCGHLRRTKEVKLLYAVQGSCAEAETLPSAHHAKQLSSAQTISPRGVLDKPRHSVGTMTMDEGHVRSALYEHEDHLQSGRIQSFSMEQDDHSSDEDNNSEDESCLRRSARNHGTDRLHSVSSRPLHLLESSMSSMSIVRTTCNWLL